MVFAVTAVAFAWSARLSPRHPARRAARTPTPRAILPALFAGFRAIAVDPALRVVVGVMGAQTLVAVRSRYCSS